MGLGENGGRKPEEGSTEGSSILQFSLIQFNLLVHACNILIEHINYFKVKNGWVLAGILTIQNGV